MQLRREIGLQFLILVQSPFFGINLMEAVKKLCDSLPVPTQKFAYLVNGVRRRCQNFLIKQLLMPSGPEAVLSFVSFAALSSSKIEMSLSRKVAVSREIFILLVKGEAKMSSPKNPSMHPVKLLS